jgi:hypothetical protein
LANFFAKTTETIEHSPNPYAKEEQQFHILALMAMLIKNASPSVLNKEATFSFLQHKKTFAQLFLTLDVEDLLQGPASSAQRSKELFKILGVILVSLIRNKAALRAQKLLDLTKSFILQQLPLLRDGCTLSYYVTGLTQILSDVAFTEAELRKHATVDVLVALVAEGTPLGLLMGALKVLKFFWQKNLVLHHHHIIISNNNEGNAAQKQPQ